MSNLSKTSNFSLFCWNIANPSIERATAQAQWLKNRLEEVFVLTEAKKSDGCMFLERYFLAYGYNVIFPKPEKNEFATMIISKYPLEKNNFSDTINFLNARVVAATVKLPNHDVEIIGVYVPSRNADSEKIEKKRNFLKILLSSLESNQNNKNRVFCGDFNVLEPNHIPHYLFFQNWEYEFYQKLFDFQLQDAFRFLNPKEEEYSWVGRTGDGYRYDHCFLSDGLISSLKKCSYYHQTRINPKLSDHSALLLELDQ